MSIIRIGHERQARDHSRLDVTHDDSGKVWLSVVPNDKYDMTFEGEKTGGIAFPLPPDLAASIGQSLIDHALLSTPHEQAMAN